MSMVSYRCPDTGNDVATAIESDAATLTRMQASQLKIWFWCPHCMAGHQIDAADARVQEQAELADSAAE